MLFTDEQHRNFAKDPAVINFDGKYFLYYSTRDTVSDKLLVGIAKSCDMENWTIVDYLPLDDGVEINGIGAPAAIVLNGKVHLFYQTYGNWKEDAICHAVSSDGVHFEKDKTNPIYRPTDDWCCGRAIDADICVFGTRLYLYIATRDHDMRIQKIGGAYADLKSDFSRSAWTQITSGALVAPEMKWEGECIEAPATVVDDGKIYMFYGGSYNCTPQQIGCAVSSDGAFFEKISSEPFLPCGKEGEWNSSESGHPYAFRDDDGRVYLFYQGSNDDGKTWYLSKKEIYFESGLPKYKGLGT